MQHILANVMADDAALIPNHGSRAQGDRARTGAQVENMIAGHYIHPTNYSVNDRNKSMLDVFLINIRHLVPNAGLPCEPLIVAVTIHGCH